MEPHDNANSERYMNKYENTTPRKPVAAPTLKQRHWPRMAALALCCALVGGALGTSGTLLVSGAMTAGKATTIQEGQRETAAVNVAYVNTQREMTLSEVYAANVNSTVGIRTSVTTNLWGFQTTSAAAGSGFILTEDGYILTNYHVIENSNAITVSLYDGPEYDAKLVGYDESNDIAVLKVDVSGLQCVTLGDSGSLKVGDMVLAIGNPLGELTFSLTHGAVSALDRKVTLSGNVTMKLIQTDCAINSGNSGGALFNLYGEVVGITNAKYSSSGSSSEASIDNIGFAIPINTVRQIVQDIIETGSFTKPYIGVSLSSVSTEARRYGLPGGAAVKSVSEDSPADQAGLKENDIITAINGASVTSGDQAVEMIRAAAKGDVLTLSVYRQGETLELQVTVGEHTQSALANEESVQQTQQLQRNYPRGYGHWD